MSADCWYCAPDPFDAYVISDCEACNERAAFRKRIEELEAEMLAAADRIEELEAENKRLRSELEDDTLIVSLMSDSSDEVFATLELTKEEHSQLLRVGIMELIKLGMKKDGVL